MTEPEKIVEIPLSQFNELVEELKKCREEKEKLFEINDYLNSQIKEYNEKFTNQEEK